MLFIGGEGDSLAYISEDIDFGNLKVGNVETSILRNDAAYKEYVAEGKDDQKEVTIREKAKMTIHPIEHINKLKDSEAQVNNSISRYI